MKKEPIVFYNVLTYYSYIESTKLYDSCSAQGNSFAKTKEIVRIEIQKHPNKYPSFIRFGTFLTFYGKTFFYLCSLIFFQVCMFFGPLNKILNLYQLRAPQIDPSAPGSTQQHHLRNG